MSKILDSLLLKDTKTGEATEYQIQDSQLKARVDNLIANAGNTDDNAELIDIRVGEDGTQYPTAGEAVRGQVSKLKKDLVDYTEMLYNGTTNIEIPILVNKAIDNDTKEVTSYSSRRATNETLIYIPIGSCISVSANSGFTCGIFGFDENKTYNFGRYAYGGGDVASITNSDSRYARLLVYKNDNSDISVLEANNAISVYLSTEKHISQIEDSNKLVKIQLGKNLFDKTKATSGYISTSSGGINDSATYSVSDYIPIKQNQSIVISPKIRHFLAYDNTKKSISSSYISTSTTNLVYTATIDGYVRFDFYTTQLDIQQAEYGTTPTNYEPYAVKSVEENIHMSQTMFDDIASKGIADVLNGKTIMAFGDSIMAGDGNGGTGIADILGSKHSMTVLDYSLGGAAITYDSEQTTDRRNITAQVSQAISSVSTSPDYIIFDGLTNDINGGAVKPLGEISDGYNSDFDNATFCGAFEWIVRTLRTAYPSSKLVYVRVHHMSSRNLGNQNTFGNKAEEMCEKWGVPIANIYKNGGLNTFLDAMHKYTYASTSQPSGDKTHPTQEGYELFYIPIIESVLKSI